MSVKIYNTLTRKKETYEPLNKDYTGFYVCGPTVYDYFHIGNARAFIVFDVVRRYLIYRGYNVRYVMNLTDIDDKIIRRANDESVSSQEISTRYINAFFEDIQKLGIRPADVYPRATDHIPDILDLIQRLIEKGIAYASDDGDVFYDISMYERYAALSKKNLDELQAGKRIAIDDRKRNAADFVLWKSAKPGEPWWKSPWGNGRPGWHIECSVMAMKYLGESFDFHAGGQDLIFPHHENEIAQSCGATEAEYFAKYWLHNGFLDIKGEKMSKSLGNFITARNLVKHYPASAIRIFFLQKHYRSPMDFTEEGLNSAKVTAGRLALTYQKAVDALGDYAGAKEPDSYAEGSSEANFLENIAQIKKEVVDAMDDDFNSSAAIGKIFDLSREINKFIDGGINEDNKSALAQAFHEFASFDSFFGIVDKDAAGVDSEQIDNVMQAVIKLRQSLRKEKNWPLADQLRDDLTGAGIILEDTAGGTEWRWRK